MSDHTAIQWTDATWNPTTGCTKVSPGCAHCYIERTAAFRIHGRKFVDGATDLRLHADRLAQPLHWRKPRRVFVNSLSDLFHEDVPDAFIDQVFAVMALTPQHTFQVLTKRPERMLAYVSTDSGTTGRPHRVRDAIHTWHDAQWPRYRLSNALVEHPLTVANDLSDRLTSPRWPLPNVWLGVSVENQHFADERIPLLLDTPAAVRFISAEPLLADVGLWAFLDTPERNKCLGILGGKDVPGLDWVIVGGESGPCARPFDVAWARAIVQQCQAAGVACFVKQLGATPFEAVEHVDVAEHVVFGPQVTRYTEPRELMLHDEKGGDIAEWPSDLRVREFPAR